MGRRPAAGGIESESPTWPAFWKESGNAGPRERWLPARPPPPHSAPLAACETRSAGRHHARGEGCQARPGPAAASPDGAHVLVMAGLASRQQPRGRGGCHGRIQSWSVSVRVPGGKLHAAPVGAGIAGGRLGAPSPKGLRKASPLQGGWTVKRSPSLATPPAIH